ncbi:hypothetical protein C9374_003085 [Naegleria lovaniensis]|uniref:Homeobox domain-containing protein n=1 Tax=Naegleria lovaniensis TaxID=51637 RepID=A0AA88GPI1_NAELO|nr:uncharacterized protein C9374_003085 [Naegleria lovaniensis]KAG2385936.1 hypothetical protein C9374_003085 [Naegleria lovaniensis]
MSSLLSSFSNNPLQYFLNNNNANISLCQHQTGHPFFTQQSNTSNMTAGTVNSSSCNNTHSSVFDPSTAANLATFVGSITIPSQSVSTCNNEWMNQLLHQIDQSLDILSNNLIRDIESIAMESGSQLKKRKLSEAAFDDDSCQNHEVVSSEALELQQLQEWIQSKKRKKNNSQGKKEILKEFLMINKSNPYPSERQKEVFMKELDYDKKQLNNWFINARKRYLRKKVAYTPPDIRNKNEFDSILENKVRQSMSNGGVALSSQDYNYPNFQSEEQ